MNLEDQIKETLMKHAEDVRPDAASWNGVETKVRRAHYARVAMVSTFTVALIAAAAVVLPRLSTETKKNGFSGQSPSASATGEPAPLTTGNVHVSPALGFRISIPDGWRSSWFEGTYEFGPKDLPSLAQGGNTFAVTVDILHGKYDSFASDILKDNSSAIEDPVSFKGHRADRVQMTNGGTHQMWTFIEWDSCLKGLPQCSNPEEGSTLQVHVTGTTESLWDSNITEGKAALESIDAYDGSQPIHGKVDSGVPRDAHRQALILFLDARAEGLGAEELMEPLAAQFYERAKTPDALLPWGLYEANGKPLVSYEVRAECKTSSDFCPPPSPGDPDAKFPVTLHFEGEEPYYELITVKAGDSAPMVEDVCTGCD